MKLEIHFCNSAGILDRVFATDGEHAARVLRRMLESIDELHEGDRFLVVERGSDAAGE